MMSDSENTSQEIMEENSGPLGPSYIKHYLLVRCVWMKTKRYAFKYEYIIPNWGEKVQN